MKIRIALACLFTLTLALGFAGCASDAAEEDQEHVSTIPWNRPQNWEHKGPIGGAGTGY